MWVPQVVERTQDRAPEVAARMKEQLVDDFMTENTPMPA
jgi:hypothetical protein